jgi:hypothetical protein
MWSRSAFSVHTSWRRLPPVLANALLLDRCLVSEPVAFGLRILQQCLAL